MRVFATRPLSANKAWMKRLKLEGFEPIALPLLEIDALKEPSELTAIKQVILQLDEAYACIFVSKNAVEHGIQWIDQYWPQIPEGIHWLAIGEKTAQKLNSHLEHLGVSVHTSALMNSEALLELDLLKDVDAKKIIVFRGLGGRPLLAETLEQRGASIRYCELYARCYPSNCTSQLQASHIRTHKEKGDVVAIFSGEALANVYRAAKGLNELKLNHFLDVQLLVPGERVARAARDLGFVNVAVAGNASEESMLAGLRALVGYTSMGS